MDNDYHLFKSDILSGLITYSTDKNMAANMETITAQRAHEIIDMNRHGEKPLSLLENDRAKAPKKHKDLLEDDINRFDSSKRKKKNKNRNVSNNNIRPQVNNTEDGNANSNKNNDRPQRNNNRRNYPPKVENNGQEG
jgi:hypothetical protein